MQRLAREPEHLDGTLDDRAVLAGNLRDLSRINRLFGGTALTLEALRALFEPDSARGRTAPELLRVLDVGTGAGDIPVAIVQSNGPWRDAHVTAIDSRPEVIEAARSINPALASDSRIELAVADGLALPYPDNAFDVAHASLVLHHLEPDAAVLFLRELARVARVGVVVNDLGRGRLAWFGAWLILHALTRNRFTLHDGPLSVRRAYTLPEARDLLARAGLVPVFEAAGLVGHRWVITAVRR